MVSVTCRLITGVTETAGGGGAPWAAATPQDAATLSAPMAAFPTKKLRANIGSYLLRGVDVRFRTPPLRDSLHLREAAIHEQFGSRDVAAVVTGGQRNFSFKLAHEVPRIFGPHCDDGASSCLPRSPPQPGTTALAAGEKRGYSIILATKPLR